MDAYTIIKRRDDTGEKRVALQMTDEEFDQIVEKYAHREMTFKRYTPYLERLKKATEKTEDELKFENYISMDTEGFEKAVVMFGAWTEKVLRELQREKNFRIEIGYDAEELKTDFCIYTTPKESGTNDTMKGNQAD